MARDPLNDAMIMDESSYQSESFNNSQTSGAHLTKKLLDKLNLGSSVGKRSLMPG
jgi:hypothetical protein